VPENARRIEFTSLRVATVISRQLPGMTAGSPWLNVTLVVKDKWRHMDSDFGLLWIPAGFVLIFASVAALFLTVSA
jgi:hypothetical protein